MAAWGGRRCLTRGVHRSVKQRTGRLVSDCMREAGGARASQATGESGLGPNEKTGKGRAAARKDGRWVVGEGLGCRLKTEKRREFPFLFLFQIFQSIFKLF
jgi:hypothetical protein